MSYINVKTIKQVEVDETVIQCDGPSCPERRTDDRGGALIPEEWWVVGTNATDHPSSQYNRIFHFHSKLCLWRWLEYGGDKPE